MGLASDVTVDIISSMAGVKGMLTLTAPHMTQATTTYA